MQNRNGQDTGINSTQDVTFEQERERMHRQMLSTLSHDLKTPLSAVIGSLQIFERLQDNLSVEKKNQLISTALSEAIRLDNFINNILDMARLENGMFKTKKELCNIDSLLKDCVEKSAHSLSGKDIKVIPTEGEIKILADPSLIFRILGILIDNAFKYGGANCEVRLKSWEEGSKIIIQVIDNGPGIPEDKMEEIFSKYTRVKLGDQQAASTGLGLAIGRSIAELHNGKLYGANGPEKGAVFTLELAGS